MSTAQTVREYPSIPRAADAPAGLFEEGHLWVQEKVCGGTLRFQLQAAGFLQFGDETTVYDDHDAVPEPYRPAVRHVRDQLDRDGLQTAVDDVEQVVFFGVSTHHRRLDYDWGRLPPFLGFDIWGGGEFLTPGAVHSVFERLGLQPVNAVERELPARDFDPDSYTVPDSAWYDGPAEGVLVRNKRGDRASLRHPDFRAETANNPTDTPVEELTVKHTTPGRLERLATALERQDNPVTVDTLRRRVAEQIAREHAGELPDPAEPLGPETARSTVRRRVREFLTERYR